mmetsp:Transcript_99865/g.321905  ORF Transcript_99865/g.321905 Transcript_99865/m.321905 type:complete len:266 (-) Transcript_99865:278-1075(-)
MPPLPRTSGPIATGFRAAACKACRAAKSASSAWFRRGHLATRQQLRKLRGASPSLHRTAQLLRHLRQPRVAPERGGRDEHVVAREHLGIEAAGAVQIVGFRGDLGLRVHLSKHIGDIILCLGLPRVHAEAIEEPLNTDSRNILLACNLVHLSVQVFGHHADDMGDLSPLARLLRDLFNAVACTYSLAPKTSTSSCSRVRLRLSEAPSAVILTKQFAMSWSGSGPGPGAKCRKFVMEWQMPSATQASTHLIVAKFAKTFCPTSGVL